MSKAYDLQRDTVEEWNRRCTDDDYQATAHGISAKYAALREGREFITIKAMRSIMGLGK